jgi:hypothetical protein
VRCLNHVVCVYTNRALRWINTKASEHISLGQQKKNRDNMCTPSLLFIYVFNDVSSVSDLDVFRHWMIGWEMNRKRCGRKRCWSELKHCLLRYQEGLNETTRGLGITGLRAKIWTRNLLEDESKMLTSFIPQWMCRSSINMWHMVGWTMEKGRATHYRVISTAIACYLQVHNVQVGTESVRV